MAKYVRLCILHNSSFGVKGIYHAFCCLILSYFIKCLNLLIKENKHTYSYHSLIFLIMATLALFNLWHYPRACISWKFGALKVALILHIMAVLADILLVRLLLPLIHCYIFMLADSQPPIVLTGLLLVVVLMAAVTAITDIIVEHIHMVKGVAVEQTSALNKIRFMLVS